VTDVGCRTASKTLRVQPQCGEAGVLGAQCLCICKAGYVLG
jgi:hypothetical protein